ncbi:MAG: YebC/PmpR family DNA-binding transcriptional regulator [bacterium]|nr:YebC/PmpR family DNA-binding transcriptional regulator [bacterium]
MSGHSKWATIKHKKAAQDAKRGQLFTKLSRLVSVAAKEGGSPDPAANYRLRLAVEQAKKANMPMEKIQRAIDRVFGKGKAALESVELEVFGFKGIGIIILALTDKKQRLLGEVKSILNRYGGSLGQSGSVTYMFKKVVILELEKRLDDEKVLELADEGVVDFKRDKDKTVFFVEIEKAKEVREKVEGLGLESEKVGYIPVSTVALNEAEWQRLQSLVEELESLDDVYQVFTNGVRS